MIKLQSDKIEKAIAKAKAAKPHVRCTGDRVYEVRGSKGDRYTVRFVVADGVRLGECDCQAGSRNLVCYHLVAAASLNIAIHSNYSKPSETPKGYPNEGILVKREPKGHQIEGWFV